MGINLYKYLFISIEKCIFAPNKSPFKTFGCPSKAFECPSESFECASKAFERRKVRGSRTNSIDRNNPLDGI